MKKTRRVSVTPKNQQLTSSQIVLLLFQGLIYFPFLVLITLVVNVLFVAGVILFLPVLLITLLFHFAALLFKRKTDKVSVEDEKIDPIYYARRASREIN